MMLDIAIRCKSAPFIFSAVAVLLDNVLQHYVNFSVSAKGEGVGGKWMWVI